ncbi:MAG: hypothetical protein WAU45_19620 [Blastocatellia bacterium]
MKRNWFCDRQFRLLRLRTCVMVLICGLVGSRAASTTNAQNGPEVKSFLDFMRHEEDELEFQIRHNEITRKEYARSKSRIAIHRQTVLRLVEETGQDHVPELHVVAAGELDQLIDDGTAAVKGIKPGDVVKLKWRYLGSEKRGEAFYIFERLPRY